MGRLVQEKIKQPLAEELLFGKLVNGGEVKVRIKDNAPAFEIVPAAAQGRQRQAQSEGEGCEESIGRRTSRRIGFSDHHTRRTGGKLPALFFCAFVFKACAASN